MRIILHTLNISNFKGIKELNIQFDPFNTGIFAANECGKTTISDAWHWLLTGKDSIDRKDFNIKNTADTSLNRADHEVTASLAIDGTDMILRKIYREKWEKKRGTENTELTGHETLYYVNEVLLSQADYQNRINGLMPENLLKMISNPLYFNRNITNWGWKDRREVLMAVAGTIDNNDVFGSITTPDNTDQVAALRAALKTVKDIHEYRSVIITRKKKLRDELLLIPARIDEVKRGTPEVQDWPEIEKSIKVKEAEIAKIEALLTDNSKAAEAQQLAITEHRNKLFDLNRQKNEMYLQISDRVMQHNNSRTSKRSEISTKLSDAQRAVDIQKNTITDLENQVTRLNDEAEELRKKWAFINAEELTLNENEFACPTCKRAFEASDVNAKKEQLAVNFNSDKERRLRQVNEDGIGKINRVKTLENDLNHARTVLAGHLSDLKTAESDLNAYDAVPAELKNLENELANDKQYNQLASDIVALQANAPRGEQTDNTSVLTQRLSLNTEIDSLKKQLNTRDLIKRCDLRVEELKSEEKNLSQQLAELERTEFLIEAFDKTKMDILEERVNGKFKYVRFKLFDRQVNGAESPTCETLYKGVPFSDLNTAGRIWAGMDIINTLSQFYGVSAPIFLDNRESVTDIPEMDSQVINLVVSPADKKIRIVAGSRQLAEA